MISYFINLLGRMLRAAMILCVVLPFIWIISTPLILIAAVFVPGAYKDNVARGFWLVSKNPLIWGDVRFTR